MSVPGLIFIIQSTRGAGGSSSERERVTTRDYREECFMRPNMLLFSFEIVIKYDTSRVRMLYYY